MLESDKCYKEKNEFGYVELRIQGESYFVILNRVGKIDFFYSFIFKQRFEKSDRIRFVVFWV